MFYAPLETTAPLLRSRATMHTLKIRKEEVKKGGRK